MLYNLEDTIAAITTPPGTGAVGVIRISGPGAVKIVDKYFAPSAVDLFPKRLPTPWCTAG